MEFIRKFSVVDVCFFNYVNGIEEERHRTGYVYLVIEKVNGTKKLSVCKASGGAAKAAKILKESTDMLPEIGKIAAKTMGAFIKKASGYNGGMGGTAYSISKDMEVLGSKYEQHKKENFNLSELETCDFSFSFSPKTTIEIFPNTLINASKVVVRDYVVDYTANDGYRHPMMSIDFLGPDTALEFADLISDILNGATLKRH